MNDVQFVKWIFSAPGHPEFMDAIDTLRESKACESFSLQIDYDHAPASKQAKVLEQVLKSDAFKHL